MPSSILLKYLKEECPCKMCDYDFTCASVVHILGEDIEGEGFFILMLIVCLVLQILANYVWGQNAQVSRELLQKPTSQRGSVFDLSSLMGRSIMWTVISTFIWIVRIILIMGNNVWIYLVVLIGNALGVYLTQRYQAPDAHYLADDILHMLARLRTDSNENVLNSIHDAISKLKTAMDDEKTKAYPQYLDDPQFKMHFT